MKLYSSFILFYVLAAVLAVAASSSTKHRKVTSSESFTDLIKSLNLFDKQTETEAPSLQIKLAPPIENLDYTSEKRREIREGKRKEVNSFDKESYFEREKRLKREAIAVEIEKEKLTTQFLILDELIIRFDYLVYFLRSIQDIVFISTYQVKKSVNNLFENLNDDYIHRLLSSAVEFNFDEEVTYVLKLLLELKSQKRKDKVLYLEKNKDLLLSSSINFLREKRRLENRYKSLTT